MTTEPGYPTETFQGKNARARPTVKNDVSMHRDKLPPEVIAILDDHIERLRKAIYPYLQCRITCEALASIGFNCEFDLHANLYDLRPLKGAV